MMNGHSHNITEKPKPLDRGPLSGADMNTNGESVAEQVFAQFTALSRATMTWADWVALRAIIAQHVAGVMNGLQVHLLGCTSVWAAMLAPEDQGPLAACLQHEIERLQLLPEHASRPEVVDAITHLHHLLEKVSTTRPPAQA